MMIIYQRIVTGGCRGVSISRGAWPYGQGVGVGLLASGQCHGLLGGR
jgi:hypothetical protein